MDNPTNFKAAIMTEPILPAGSNVMRTPLGNIYSSSSTPPLPPPLGGGDSINTPPSFGSYSSGFGSYSNGYGGLGSNFGGYGASPFGYSGYGNSMYGGGMFGNGNYGRGYSNNSNAFLNPHDPESRFIQLAEANSRSAFESIGSLVSAVANISAMLDSTFFAITSSFHAILGVAANFGKLRGVFSQFWQTFAIFRGITWIYKKLLYWLRLSNIDPSSEIFKEAFEAAKNEISSSGQFSQNFNKRQSPWPVAIFIGFIFTAPYVVMKLLGNLTSSVIQETKDPRRWTRPVKTVALYDFQARNSSELTITAGQKVYVAPKEIQNAQKLLNTGWALATVDAINSGLIPITYCKKITNETETIKEQLQNAKHSIIPIPSEENIKHKILNDDTTINGTELKQEREEITDSQKLQHLNKSDKINVAE